MLPFLKKKKAMVATNAEDESLKRKPDDGSEPFEMLDAVCEDMMDAIHNKNHKLLRFALREVFGEDIQDMDEEQDEQTLDEEQE